MSQEEIREQVRKAAATLDGLDPAIREALTYRTNRIRMQPEMEPESDAPPLRRGTQLQSRPLEPRTTMPDTPATPAVIGQDAVEAESGSRTPAKPKRPAITRSDAATCQCGARWTGTSKCHCSAAGCHRLFSSINTFDRHRVNGQCVDPETIMVKPRDGSPKRRAMVNRDGIWCSSDEFGNAGQLFGSDE